MQLQSMRACPACGASLEGRRKRDKFCNQTCHGRWMSDQAQLAAEAVLAAGEKPCTKCGETKRLTEFYEDRSKLDGRRNSCTACDLAYQKQPEARERRNAWGRSEKGKATQWRYRHLGNGDAVKKAYATRPDRIEKTREIMRRSKRKWYHRTKDSPTQVARRSSEEFRSARRERHRRWYRKDGVRERVIAQKVWSVTRRRTLKAGLPATLTKEQWEYALEWFGNRCVYCGTSGPFHQDHFIPLTRGGGFTASNILPACPSCNGSKQDRMPEAWCSPEAYNRALRYFADVSERYSDTVV